MAKKSKIAPLEGFRFEAVLGGPVVVPPKGNGGLPTLRFLLSTTLAENFPLDRLARLAGHAIYVQLEGKEQPLQFEEGTTGTE